MRNPPATDLSRVRPWLGRAAFAKPAARAPRRMVAQTEEERFWRRWFPSVFAPGRSPTMLSRVLNHIGVTPMAHVTLLNLDYQIYLNQVLHTAGGTWLGHIVCIPINVGLLFYALAFYTGTGSGGGFTPLAMNAGLLLLALLAIWYAAMAVRMRAGLWGFVSLALLTALWMLGNGCASLALAAELPWYLEPITLIIAVSSLQAYSHLFEENVPPRANFEGHWMPVRDFIWGDRAKLSLGRRLVRLAWTPIGGIWGTIDEWWASAKLMPFYMLELLWMCGYQREQRDHFRRVSLTVLESGDPALDFVGIGGGASVVELGEIIDSAERPIADPEPTWA